jgi:type IV fimbrial biogenesis protein FimT
MDISWRHARSARAARGLTLVELLAALAIVAVLIGVAAPALDRLMADWRVTHALNALTGSMRLARTEAIARSRHVVLCQVDSDASTTCQSAAGARGYASGWIVFVNNDGDASHNYSPANGDELLLRQTALPGLANMGLSKAGRFVFLPNGLLNSNNNAVNVDAQGYDSPATTPWARKAICISRPGRIRYVADASNCS